MAVCTCDNTLSNTGRPGCIPLTKVLKRLILVSKYKQDGTRNYIDPAATLDASYITAKLNNTDKYQRWFPVGEFKNVTQPKADPTYETFADTSKIKTQEGIKSFEGFLLQGTSNYLSKLENFECNKMATYIIDKDGNLRGTIVGTDGYIYPVSIAEGTWNPVLSDPTDTESSKIHTKFDWHIDERDGNLRMITADAFGTNLTTIQGLIDVTATITSPSTTGFVAMLRTYEGPINDRVEAEGWVVGNFALYNVTDSASITITSVTESTTTPGLYTFVIPAQTSADVMRLTDAKNGYYLEPATITVP